MTNQVIKTVPEYYNFLVELLQQGKELYYKNQIVCKLELTYKIKDEFYITVYYGNQGHTYVKFGIETLNGNLKIASDIKCHFDLG